MAKERLGQILIRAGLLDERGLQGGLDEQQRWGGPLGRHLVALDLISEETLVRALSTQCKLPAVALDPMRIDPNVGRLLPQLFCERNQLICFRFDEIRRCVGIAMADPASVEVIEQVSQLTRCSARRYFAAPSAIERSIQMIFHDPGQASGEIDVPSGLRSEGRHVRSADRGPVAPERPEGALATRGQQPERLARAVAPPAIRERDTNSRSRVSAKQSAAPPPVPRGEGAAPPPVPRGEGAAPPPVPRGEGAGPPPVPPHPLLGPSDRPDEMPLASAIDLAGVIDVPIALDLEALRQVRDDETAGQRLARVEDMLARDGQLLEQLLAMLLRKGLLTKQELERMCSRL
jgi:hypothetical protein